ncbi:MAG TPA: hypothetical protein PKM01_02280 [Anaerolineaceae bacterium]|nr:hypothetical protein [Anaerolineaceae bacterium]
MTRLESIKGNVLEWLLEADSPGVRYLALRDLAGRSENDPELKAACRAAHQQGPIAKVLDAMSPEGYWVQPGAGYAPKYRGSVWAMILLAQLGARIDQDERIATACQYMLEHALARQGQFSYNGAPSGTFDCLQGNLCWALQELGCLDSRLDGAFEWMARSQTGNGIAPITDKKAEVRFYTYKCGPNFECGANNRQPCGWGAVKVMLAFSKLPPEKRTAEIKQAIQQGVDFLFSGDPAMANYPTPEGQAPSHNWWKFGFPVFYVTDLLQNVEALAGLGYGNDPRLSRALEIIRDKQDADGRWAMEYDYTSKTWVNFGPKKRPNKWVTLRALRVLKIAEQKL